MKASELRLGNLVLCEGEIATVQIIHGRLNIVVVDTGERDWCSNPDKLQPIPLTYGVMDALGFYTKFGEIIHPDFEHHYFYSPMIPEWHVVNDCGDTAYETVQAVFTTLHDLQNYYFALKGEELSIDLDKLKQVVK